MKNYIYAITASACIFCAEIFAEANSAPQTQSAQATENSQAAGSRQSEVNRQGNSAVSSQTVGAQQGGKSNANGQSVAAEGGANGSSASPAAANANLNSAQALHAASQKPNGSAAKASVAANTGVAANSPEEAVEVVEEEDISWTEYAFTPVKSSPYLATKNAQRKSLYLKKSPAVKSGESQLNIPFGAFGLEYACNAINQANAKMRADTGVGFFYDYYGVVAGVASGGASGGTNYTSEMIFGLDFDFEKIASIKGLSFTISGAYNTGANLSNRVGNFFTIAESYVTNGAMFYEMYLTQNIEINDDYSVSVNIGRMSMSDVFMSLPSFGYLVSGGIDNVPEAVFYNSPFTSSPLATWGVNAVISMPENLQMAFGAYQIPLDINSPNWNGTNFSISSDDAYMLMWQLQWSPQFSCSSGAKLSGVYQIGAYYYGGYTQEKFLGGQRGNAYGFYIQGQQQVWVDEDNPNRYVSVWAGAQFAPVESICIMPFMFYAGVQFQGFVPMRENDGLFISWVGGWFSDQYADKFSYDCTCEHVIEATYVISITENISIQPDIQYIIRPYGNPNIDNALVLAGQLIVSF